MSQLFNTYLYIPIYNILVAIVAFVPGHDMGVAIIIITALLRLVLHPFSISMFRSQRSMQRLQPKINELKAKFKDDKSGFSQATMALYKEEKVNPLSSCLPLLIQLPIIWALYKVLTAGLQSLDVTLLYSFVRHPENISSIAFGFLQLNKANYVLAVAAGIAQYFQTKMIQVPAPAVNTAGSKDEQLVSMMNKNMLYIMPVMTVVIGFQLPAGLTLYWFVTTLLTIAQQWYIFRGLDKEAAAQQK